MPSDRSNPSSSSNLEVYVEEPALTDGQRRRLRLFLAVEQAVCDRVERLCVRTRLEVTDAAVLVLGPSASALLAADEGQGADVVARFGCVPLDGGERTPSENGVVLGHRLQLHALLTALLPPSDDAPFDPYVDLLEPSSPQCVRVLILDEDAITILSYGAFVTLRLDLARTLET